MNRKFLIADKSSFFGGITANILLKAGYDTVLCQSAADARYAVENFDIDCAVIDTHLADLNGFELYNELSGRNLPVIMTSEEDSDDLFSQIMENRVSVVMIKPFQTHELLTTVRNLLEPDPETCFGLKNYLEPLLNLKRIKITNSDQIRTALKSVLEFASMWRMEFPNRQDIELVLQEMLTNAVYHSHGFTSEKESRQKVTLPEGTHVDLRFGRSRYKLGIAITDYQGRLSRERIYEVLNQNIHVYNVLQGNTEVADDFVLPSGRGLDMARKLAGEYYFIIQQNQRTEMVFLFDSRMHKDDPYSSVKIFEFD